MSINKQEQSITDMLEPGTQIDKYRIVEKIGSGGMADVYQAEDTVMGRVVALKVLPPEFARDSERVMRFEKEVRNLAALNHPHIVTIYDVGHESSYHYYTMALLPNGDLKKRITHGISSDQSVEILRQIADALRIAHSKGVIHRDIKPQNIMFDDQDWPQLTDLGIAKAISSVTRMTRTGLIVGTPHYMSPEQARGKPIDARSDLYSLGVVFYEMLTGTVPYEAEDTFAVGLMHINDPIPQLPVALAFFQHFIDRLMAKAPEERFADAEQLVKAILEFQKSDGGLPSDDTIQRVASDSMGSSEGVQVTKTLPTVQPLEKKRRGKIWAAVGFMAALVFGSGYLFSQKTNYREALPGKKTGMNTEQSALSALSKEADLPLNPSDSPPQISREASGSEMENEIKRLLELAEKDRKAARWTRPNGNNAHERYRAVLALDSENNQAKQGLGWIVDKYISLLDSAVAKENFDLAEQHLFDAVTVVPESEIIASARKRLNVARKAKAEQERNAVKKAYQQLEEKLRRTLEDERRRLKDERAELEAERAQVDVQKMNIQRLNERQRSIEAQKPLPSEQHINTSENENEVRRLAQEREKIEKQRALLKKKRFEEEQRRKRVEAEAKSLEKIEPVKSKEPTLTPMVGF